ncbi:MAG: FHA domain-containing protein [Tannerella sp.]|jgi:pSer/pThr/pTyr-binding forkhead associated (FHA) protein|nr:FHA domain-containing protein [Tannerella sp.]
MKGFKKCAHGHYYKEELVSCPYCGGHGGGMATEVIDPIDPKGKTQEYAGNREGNKTRILQPVSPSEQSNNRTVFGEEVMTQIEGREVVKKEYRSERKLVGWIVSYSFDKTGADFRLYEGRNEIGRNVECNITVPDKTMSGKHATILFKNDIFKIKDELSSHGTWVNGRDIEDEHVEIHDNDMIRLGETVFKFKTAL